MEKYQYLLEKVRIMRAYQKDYFKTRSNASLKNSKRAEQEIDALISEEKPNTPKQIQLL